MPKTYNTFSNVATGDVYTAAAHNNILTNLANYRVPPMCILTAGIAGVALGGGDIPTTIGAGTTYTEVVDTDDMFTSGVNITLNTAGVYVVTLSIAGDNTGSVWGSIVHDGTVVAKQYNASVNPLSLTTTATISTAANKTVKAQGYTSGGTSGGVRFSAVWVGQVS